MKARVPAERVRDGFPDTLKHDYGNLFAAHHGIFVLDADLY
jgi:hypothetical protein